MQTNTHVWYLAHFFLEWEIFQTKIVGKQNKFYVQQFFFENPAVHWDNVEKHCMARQATDDNMTHAHCMLDI